jgi:hypothetical protein
MGEMYSEGPVAGAAAEGHKARRPQYDEQSLNTSRHIVHQPRTLDSGVTGGSPDHANARPVALAAGSLAQVP